MRTFECLVSDGRSAAPVLTVLVVNDRERARELAARALLQNANHVSVELREDGRVVYQARREDLVGPSPPAADQAPAERRSFFMHRRREP